jgi:hypothetical protein
MGKLYVDYADPWIMPTFGRRSRLQAVGGLRLSA